MDFVLGVFVFGDFVFGDFVPNPLYFNMVTLQFLKVMTNQSPPKLVNWYFFADSSDTDNSALL